MPRTRIQATPQLEILLDGPPTTFRPGDTITGRVARSAPVVASRAWLTVTLIGRAKSKIVVQRGQAGTSVYRGRYGFFDPSATTQRLFDGPIHVPDDGVSRQAWAFSVQVPRTMDPSAVAAKNSQRGSYLPLSGAEIFRHPLPPVFYTSGASRFLAARSWEAFVEYALLAELHVEPASGKGAQVHTAALPISVGSPVPPEIMEQAAETRTASFLCRLSTYRLLPTAGTSSPAAGSSNSVLSLGGLSLQQRTKELFGSSKVPQLALSLRVEYPKVLRIGSADPIPLRVLVLPERHHTSLEIRDVPRTVTVTSASFEVRARTSLICQSAWHAHTADQTRVFDFDLKTALATRQQEWQQRERGDTGGAIELPMGEKAEPLDLGRLLGLQMDKAPKVPKGSLLRRETPLFPSFETYNIRHRHRIRWELKLAVAGETTVVGDQVDVTLIPGSGAGPNAAAVADLPPYEEYEDGAEGELDNEPPPPLDEADFQAPALPEKGQGNEEEGKEGHEGGEKEGKGKEKDRL